MDQALTDLAGAYLIHPIRAIEFAVMALVTLGLLVSLVAFEVVLLVSVSLSVVAYLSFRS